MKKYFSILLVLVVALTGCGQKTPYEQLSSDVSSLKSVEYVMMELGLNIDGVEVNYQAEIDPKTPLMHVTIMGQELYVTSDTLYAQVLGAWYNTKLTEEQINEIEDEFNFDVYELEMPDGNVPNDLTTNIEAIDSVIAGKNLNDIVVKTDNGYSIQGLEDSLNITTKDNQMSLEYSDPNSADKATLTFGKTDKFEIPAEAYDGNKLPDGYLDTLV